MPTPSAKMLSTLRLFTRAGRERTFSTTLVEDTFTRPLRSLVDDGFLTMDYTGTRRVYTITDQGQTYLEGKPMRKKQLAAEPAAANGHAEPPPAQAEPPRPRKPRGEPQPPPYPPSGPLSPLDVIRMMRQVRDYADAHEGVDALLAMIQRVEELGHRFGGLDCVRESLLAIREFRGEK